MIVIADISALRIWAKANASVADDRWTYGKAGQWESSAKDLAALASVGLECSTGNPVHVLVNSEASRIQSDRVVNHIWSGPLPPGSLSYLAPGILVTSPEFCCLQMAGHLTVAQTAAVMMEVMGFYGKDDIPRGFWDRDALTTKERLRSYLHDAKGAYGARKARKALEFALERSRSPMETYVALVLTLPQSVGGYGLPAPELNYLVRPKSGELAVCQSPYYTVDGCWPQSKTAYEYNGYSVHMGKLAHDQDAMKWNTLKSLGWKVTQITYDQLSGHSLDVLARQIAKDLGVRRKPPDVELRNRLLEELK